MNRDEQTGGDNSMISKTNDKFNIPKYKEQMNNPMIPNEQKRIYAESRQNQPVQENKNQLINLQIYQPQKPAPSAPKMPPPSVIYPNFVPNPFDPIGYASHMQAMNYNMPKAPVYNEYNINIEGLSGSQLRTAMIFEDAMPAKNIGGTFKSVGERNTMYEAIRSNLFTQGDGKDIPIENDSYNLLSHLKLMDMNPYNASRFSKNPYKGLPFGFLLYRSCYPMRFNSQYYATMCAPNSTGLNIRIYRLTNGAYMINKQNVTSSSDYDEWREIAFYNYVKEHILKPKVCPNFPFMYGYNITLNANIKFDELKPVTAVKSNNLVQNNVTNNIVSMVPQNQNPIKVLSNVTIINTRPTILPSDAIVSLNNNLGPKNNGMMPQINPIANPSIELNKYSGKVLVCLTEACNYSLFGWAKKEYRADGNVKTMINSGYHSKAVWESIIFQLMASMYVMQSKGININNFRLDRNVFIKDINSGGNVTDYWKYKIEGIDYYIPNYGYLVIVDSNYRDFDIPFDCDNETDKSRKRKLEGAFIGNSSLTQNDCILKSFDMFKSAIDPNIFDQDFVNDNGVKPPEDILRLLTNIRNTIDSKPSLNIAYYIRKFMTMFINNRIGGPLQEIELNHVKRGAVKEFRRGQIVVMTDNDGIDKFVLHVNAKNDVSRIVTKDKIDPNNANFIEKDVPTSSLNEYSIVEPIRQIFKSDQSNLNEDALIETYNLDA